MPLRELSEFKLSLSLGYNQGIRSVSRNNEPENITKEYTTPQTTVSSINITDETTKVTSIRINQELYGKVKKYAKDNKIQLVDIFSEMMIDYLKKNNTLK